MQAKSIADRAQIGYPLRDAVICLGCCQEERRRPRRDGARTRIRSAFPTAVEHRLSRIVADRCDQAVINRRPRRPPVTPGSSDCAAAAIASALSPPAAAAAAPAKGANVRRASSDSWQRSSIAPHRPRSAPGAIASNGSGESRGVSPDVVDNVVSPNYSPPRASAVRNKLVKSLDDRPPLSSTCFDRHADCRSCSERIAAGRDAHYRSPTLSRLRNTPGQPDGYLRRHAKESLQSLIFAPLAQRSLH